MFQGSCVALVTPMTPTGEIDEKSLIDLVEWHIKEGTQAIVIAGSTGESATLTAKEQQWVLTIACATAKKRIPIIAGTGTNATTSTIERTQAAEKIGVEGCLIVNPYFNKPTQEGLIQHYKKVSEATTLPILLYNVPSRTACDLLPTTVATLSYIPNIIGIKEATGNIQRLKALQAQCQSNFLFYSGDDPTAFTFMQEGGHGVISITANVVPRLMQKMSHWALAKETAKAQEIERSLSQLHELMVVETNPIPVKWALAQMGKIANGIRLPLTPLSSEHHDKMKQALSIAANF